MNIAHTHTFTNKCTTAKLSNVLEQLAVSTLVKYDIKSRLMVLTFFTPTLKAVDAFLLLVSSKPFMHSTFQKLSMLLV